MGSEHRPSNAADGPTIDLDILCVSCGYNLRGQPVQAACPECGTPVARSVRGEVLRFADVHWLQHLCWGIDLLLWAAVLGLTGGFLGLVMRPSPPWLNYAGLALTGGFCTGLFLLTSTEPRLAHAAPRPLARGAVRIGAALTLAQAGLAQMLAHLPTGPAAQALALGAAISGLGLPVALHALGWLLIPIARRASTTSLVPQTIILMWTVPIVALAIPVAGLVFALTPLTGHTPTMLAFLISKLGALLPLALLAGCALLFLGLILLWEYRLILRDAHQNS